MDIRLQMQRDDKQRIQLALQWAYRFIDEWPDKNGIRDGVAYSNKAWGMSVYVFRKKGRVTVREQA